MNFGSVGNSSSAAGRRPPSAASSSDEMDRVKNVQFSFRNVDPKSYALDIAFTAAFIAIAWSMWRGKNDAVPWAVSLAVVLIITWIENNISFTV